MWLFGGYLALYFLVLLSPADSLILSYPEWAWKAKGQAWFEFIPGGLDELVELIGRLMALAPVGIMMEIGQARRGKVSYPSAALAGGLCGTIASAIHLLQLDGVGLFIEPFLAAGAVVMGMWLGRLARHIDTRRMGRRVGFGLLIAVPVYLWLLWKTYGVGSAIELPGDMAGWSDAKHLWPFHAFYYGAEGGRALPIPFALALYLPVGIVIYALGASREIRLWAASIVAGLLATCMELFKLFSSQGPMQTENVLLAAMSAAAGFMFARAVRQYWLEDEPASKAHAVSPWAEMQHRVRRGGEFFIGFTLLVAGLSGALVHPIMSVWLIAALVFYTVLLWLRPNTWLWFIPATLPLLAFSPWTGQIYIDEIDCFLFATVGVGFIRILPLPAHWRLSPGSKFLVLLLTISYGASAMVGLRPIPPVDPNAFSDYLSNFNSLRLLKGFLWALLLLPLLQRSIDKEGRAFEKWVTPGILIGLSGVCLVALWERMAFVGLMNFSRDYRITATFPEMHTGGAALDGYLALALPFVFIWLFRHRGIAATFFGFGLAVLAGYAVMVTFARGLLAGIALSVGLLIITYLSRTVFQSQGSRFTLRRMFGMLLLAGVAVLLFTLLFAQGGYRTFAAGLGVMAAALVVSWTGKTRQVLGLVLTISLLALLSFALIWALPSGDYLSIVKGPYLPYALSALVFLLAVVMRLTKIGQPAFAAHAALGWLAFNMLLIAYHWSGFAALPVAGLFVLAVFTVLGLAKAGHISVLEMNRDRAVGLGVMLVCLGLAIPVLGNWFFGERFSAPVVKQDMDTRISHWKTGASLMGTGWDTTIFGIGLGRFPQAYYWQNPLGEFPSRFWFQVDGEPRLIKWGPLHYQRIQDQNNVYLTLAAGRSMEPLRYGQRVSLTPGHHYSLQLQARTKFEKAVVMLEVCEKWLLYADACSNRRFVIPAKQNWQPIVMTFQVNNTGTGWLSPTRQVSISNDSAGTVIDVDKVSLRDETGLELIKNGDFSLRNQHWFFSSDHIHLPWHAKNMWLHVWLEQGWLGVLAFSLLLATALFTAWAGWYRGDRFMGVLAFSLTGFSVVGIFDSLLDVPRVSLLFFLLVWLALLKPRKEKKYIHH